MSASVALGTGVVDAPVGEVVADATVVASTTDARPVAPVAQAPVAAPYATTMPAPVKHQATIAQPTKPATFGQPADGPGIGGAVFALILVVSLILGLGWLARRMPGVGRASNNALRVVGSLSLGPRDRVVVVEVGGTQLLLGVGQGGMTTLHTLSEPLPVAQPSQGSPASPFAQLLAQHFGKKP